MPVGKKLVVAMSVVATGVSAAFFFRKDASQTVTRQEAQIESPFRQRVERRVATDATWNNRAAAPHVPAEGRGKQALRVPTAVTAAFVEPKTPSERQPSFQKSFNPVGALLEPLEGTPVDDPAESALDDEPEAALDSLDGQAARTHRIADGDTLSKLASQYLGRGERYLEIFELNRDVLASPDLLPIGAVLKIPPRHDERSPTDSQGDSKATVEPPLELAPASADAGSIAD